MLTSGELLSIEVPAEISQLAEALSKIHGAVIVSREEHGLHLRMASPACLVDYGSAELDKKHLYINAEKYFGLGQWATVRGTYNADRVAYCLKTQTPYSVSDLLSMPDLEARGIVDTIQSRVTVGSTQRILVPDAAGNMVPPGPGTVVSLNTLDYDHPAIWYLQNRGYDIQALVEQFDCGWCTKEAPEDRATGIYWKKLPLGFKRTPQGRIIFFADVHGVRQGYQGRIPEASKDGHKFYWHPYSGEWTHCEDFDTTLEKWVPIPEIQQSALGWEIAKYLTAPHMSRAQNLLGFDAAVAWNKKANLGRRVGIAIEGPLDAGRFGPPGMAYIGQRITPEQADLIVENFDVLVYITDNDKVGDKAKKKAALTFQNLIKLELPNLPETCPSTGRPIKDPGDLTTFDALDFIAPYVT